MFAGSATTGEMPAWSGLPTKTKSALTGLMARLILDHAATGCRTEGGDDL